MLEETRDWLDRAPLPLLPDPPNALLLLPLGLFGTRWLPTRSPPPRLPPTLPEPRLPMSRVPALGVRFPKVPACCCRPTFCRALAWRFCIDSPRVVPPYWLAVFRSP